jgi:hypothetical protein
MRRASALELAVITYSRLVARLRSTMRSLRGTMLARCHDLRIKRSHDGGDDIIACGGTKTA